MTPSFPFCFIYLTLLSAVECLGLLGYSPLNAPALFDLHPDVFLRILQCLLLPDVQMIVACLDALYCLSFLGGTVGEMIVQSDHCISILLNMLTFKCEGFRNAVEGLYLIHPDDRKEPVLATPTEKKTVSNDSKDTKPVSQTQSSNPHLLKKDSSSTPSASLDSSSSSTPQRPNKVVQNPLKLINQFMTPPTKADQGQIRVWETVVS